jgi:hypothetical protein
VSGFTCSCCGQYFDELPMSYRVEAPYNWPRLSRWQRMRSRLNPDLCVIENKEFYIRGRLELPVIDGPEPFSWDVWVSLSAKSYKQTLAMWEVSGRESEPPYFGWLSVRLPLYPETINLKTNVHTRPVGQTPFVELEPTDHPLAIEQREGITMARVQEIAEAVLHQRGKA